MKFIAQNYSPMSNLHDQTPRSIVNVLVFSEQNNFSSSVALSHSLVKASLFNVWLGRLVYASEKIVQNVLDQCNLSHINKMPPFLFCLLLWQIA